MGQLFKGLICAAKSIWSIYQDLKKDGAKYLVTHRTNQVNHK